MKDCNKLRNVILKVKYFDSIFLVLKIYCNFPENAPGRYILSLAQYASKRPLESNKNSVLPTYYYLAYHQCYGKGLDGWGKAILVLEDVVM